MNNASVTVETLSEARRVMGILGLDAHFIVDTMAHENAHGNRAEQLGSEHLGYQFLLIKNSDGNFIVGPKAIIVIPDEWDKERQKIVHSETLRAPADYGNEMSESDKEALKQLDN